MFKPDRDQDTICALSTPAGRGGISVVRISGKNSVEYLKKIALFFPDHPESHKVYYGHLTTKAGDLIDEVLISYFASGKSFTSEATCEISCHGNPVIVQQILKELIGSGCRAADPGEFTYRAFMNGRIDLVQAEAVLSTIESQSVVASRMALRQLQGDVSEQFETLEKNTIWLLSRFEAAIDFSTEDLEINDKKELETHFLELIFHCKKLINAFESGRVLRDGLRVALIGLPNSGKSSLLNKLVGEERAIVTEVPGTTRDLIEVDISLKGVRVSFIDSAGIRNSSDQVESIGIERSRKAAAEADLVLYLFDSSIGLIHDDEEVLKGLDSKKVILVEHKSDLKANPQGSIKYLNQHGQTCISVSSKTGSGINELLQLLESLLVDLLNEDSGVLIQARHYHLVLEFENFLKRAYEQFCNGQGEEVIAFELREGQRVLNRILGRSVDEDIISRIFKDFCIGK